MSRMRSDLMASGMSTRHPAAVHGGRLSAADRGEEPPALTHMASGRVERSRPSLMRVAPSGWSRVQTMTLFRNRAFWWRPGCEWRPAGEGLLSLLSGMA
jgi:hypothetical protein